ncbi:hypothetical protein [Bradyrhizobium prioriisuperbiae]|uniref:hypothetical protein n=1 Tax=Bradyrhizobium prioriisuperbiae TaxID=2854389 RepID=UPI0028E5E1FA|nr:hypothetical protein [Bradyrhizobium prioritasuperba]
MTHFHIPGKQKGIPMGNDVANDNVTRPAPRRATKSRRGKRKRVGRLRRQRAEQGMPTPERLAFAEGHVEIGDDEQGGRVYTIRDAPLERLSARGGIDPKEYSALMKFKQHWYHAGLLPMVGSVDLNRVFAPDPGAYSGMAKNERQVFHRQRYREAVQHIGLRASLVVERVVCNEQTLEMAGLALNWRTPAQARAAATELLRDAGYRLAQLWGIG